MFRNTVKLIVLTLLVALVVTNVAFAAAPVQQDQTIVDIASADEQFSTLVTALQAAGLVETLQGEGPFTVFAPTNEAFDKLPEGTLDSLLADTDALTQVLLYHVVDGKVLAADVAGMDSATTLQGSAAPITVDGDTVMIGDATVTATDIEASNGVIHVIDTVLLPPDMAMAEGEAMEGDEAPAEGEAMEGDEAPAEEAAPAAEAPAELPQSGGELSTTTTIIIVLAILGVVLVAGGVVLRARAARS